jgi:sugar phosphate isomerase/epimerase
MTTAVAPRDLSYYTCIVPWEGKRMVFHPEPARARLETLNAADIRWFGVDGINLCEPGESDYRKVVATVNEWMKELNLRMSSFHYAGWTYAPLDDDQGPVRDIMCESVEVFGGWRPRSFVVHASWISMPSGQTEDIEAAYQREVERHGDEAVLQTVAANLKVMAKAAAALDIRLALENLGPFSTLANREWLPRLVNAIDEPNVGYCIDSGHAHLIGESVPDWIQLAGDRLFETHFHDNRGRGVDEHWPVGFGTTSWIDIIQALDAIQFPGPVNFEAAGWPDDDPVRGYRNAIAWWRAAERLAARK